MGPERPNIKVMAANLAQTASNVFKEAVSGNSVLADEFLTAKRIEVCNTCEFLIKDQFRCSKCGCFMKAKTKILVAKCPIDKW